MRFINDDVKLRQGGRNAIKISIDDLRSELWKFISKLDDADECFNMKKKRDTDLVGLIAVSDEGLQKDIKYANYVENTVDDLRDCEIKSVGQSLLDFHTLSNGFTFYGAMGGSDWSYPMLSIFYYDGKKVRAYTPIRGNFVNVDFKSALGLEGEYYEVDEDKIAEKYQKLGIYSEPSDTESIGSMIFGRTLEDESWCDMYLKKYGLDTDTLCMNFEAMVEEIQARIVVK